MSRIVLIFSLVLVFLAALSAQQSQPQSQSPQAVTPPSYSAIPADAAKKTNPIKSSPESLSRAKKWWGLDCAMCHGKDANGKGEVAADMKLKIVDFNDPSVLKERTDGEIFYIIKNGHEPMPGEGDRLKAEEAWDLVNYVRSLAKPKPDSQPK